MPYKPTPVPRNYELSNADGPAQSLMKLQKTIDDFHKAVNQFERLALGSDCPSSVSQALAGLNESKTGVYIIINEFILSNVGN